MEYWRGKRALVTGGSAGLGRELVAALAARGARVAVAARGQSALDDTVERLRALGGDLFGISADVTRQDDVDHIFQEIDSRWGGLDLVAHCAGRSMRGAVLDTPIQTFQDLWEINTLAAVRLMRAAAPLLRASGGHIVLVGSLASRVAPRFLGAYPASKFPLAALAQQLRLELGDAAPPANADDSRSAGDIDAATIAADEPPPDKASPLLPVHTLLVLPGPIARPDSADRYAAGKSAVPPAAARPGGGAKLSAVDPRDLAERILRACERRDRELVVPRKARLLFALSQLSPRLGDWLLRRKTSG